MIIYTVTIRKGEVRQQYIATLSQIKDSNREATVNHESSRGEGWESTKPSWDPRGENIKVILEIFKQFNYLDNNTAEGLNYTMYPSQGRRPAKDLIHIKMWKPERNPPKGTRNTLHHLQEKWAQANEEELGRHHIHTHARQCHKPTHLHSCQRNVKPGHKLGWELLNLSYLMTAWILLAEKFT